VPIEVGDFRRDLPRRACERNRTWGILRGCGNFPGAREVQIILVLMVQMWLLTATLESYLAGHHGSRAAGAALDGRPVRRLRFSLSPRHPHRLDTMPESVSVHGDQAAGPWRLDRRQPRRISGAAAGNLALAW
jgi:hypothetical protein